MGRRRVTVALVPLVVAGAFAAWWLIRAEPAPMELTGSGGGYAVTVRFEHPPQAGTVTADIRVEPATAEAVWISSVMPDMGHTTAELAAQPRGPGRFRASGELFTMGGSWQLAVRVSGPHGTELVSVEVVTVDG